MTVLSPDLSAGCGCDTLDGCAGLVSMDAALAHIAAAVNPVVETEMVDLAQALGRVLAAPIVARSAVPPFDNAAMDGYAINTSGLTGAGPWRLEVVARIAAGQAGDTSVAPCQAAQIFTGAPVPQGADAVVMQENVRREGSVIVISHRVSPGANIRIAGEDMLSGDVIIPAGCALTPRDIAATAAAGCACVRVRRRVRVALLITGDEVRQPGQPMACAGIRDVNTPMLRAALEQAGAEIVEVKTVKDTRNALRNRLRPLAADVDLIVTTGGISVGEEDHVKPALADLGASLMFSGVAMKPGKPVSFGCLGRAHWLGLPGNPLSAFVTWHLFGTVLCGQLAGRVAATATRRHVVLSRDLRHTPGRCEIRLAHFGGFDSLGREVVRFDDATHSGRVAGLANADGVILIPAEADKLPKGALIEFQPFCDR